MFDAYSFYEKSDPSRNWHFSRGWREEDFSAAELRRLARHERTVGHLARAAQLRRLAERMGEVRR